jgi:hypothetical protein
MSKIETPLTVILIFACLAFFSYSVVNGHNDRIAKVESDRAFAEKLMLDAKRSAKIEARSIDITIEHDNDPDTYLRSVVLSATSSYDNERDSMEFYWKQISGNNVADINDSREKSVLNFEAESGSYGFELTVTDNYGASCVDTHWVNVAPEPNSCPVVVIKD